MKHTVQRESVEAVLAWFVAAVSAGAIIGYGAAIRPAFIRAYDTLAIWIGVFGIVIGQATRHLVDREEVPVIGIAVDAPNNATTRLYVVAAVAMLFGLGIEIAIGTRNPGLVALFGVASALCLVRGLRRGARGTDPQAAAGTIIKL